MPKTSRLSCVERFSVKAYFWQMNKGILPGRRIYQAFNWKLWQNLLVRFGFLGNQECPKVDSVSLWS